MYRGDILSEKTVIVTGASGRVGSILRRIYAARPPEGLDFLWASRIGPGSGGGEDGRAIRWDIGGDPAPVWPRGALVLHLAGTTGARSPGVNTDLIAPLLEACHQNAAAHLVFLSTAAIYAPGPEPAAETTPPAPANAYGAAKLEAERLLLAASDAALPVTVLRLGNLAGADALLAPRPAGGADTLRHGNPAEIRLDPVPGSDDGPLRSWIGPLSFAHCIASLLGQLSRGARLPQVINIAQTPPLGMASLLRASGRAWSWGPANPAVVPAAMLDTGRLAGLVPLAQARPDGIIDEIRALQALPEL